MKKINTDKCSSFLIFGIITLIFMGDLRAALSPGHGKKLQDKATEKVEFIVLESKSQMIEKKNLFDDDVEVILKVKIMSAARTSKGLKKDPIIEIRYTSISSLNPRDGDWAQVLSAGGKYIGFLLFKEQGAYYRPAANSYSFLLKQ